MEFIKKTILQKTITGTTSDCSGNCHVIIPDLSAIYHMKVLLTQEAHDQGFFDIYEFFPNTLLNYTINYTTTYSSFLGTFNTTMPIDIGIGETLLLDDNFI